MRKRLIFQRPLPYAFYNAALILVILNVIVFLLRFFTPHIHEAFLFLADDQPYVDSDRNFFILFTSLGFVASRPWTLLTALFLHADGLHLFMNMFSLLMLGMVVERKLGSHEFLLYYIFSGVLSNLGLAVLYPLLGIGEVPVLGASGAVFAVMLAYATFFPYSQLLIMGVLPVRAYVLVIGLAAFSIIAPIFGLMGNVSHLGHLGGLVFGFLYFIARLRINPVKEIIQTRRYYQ